MIKVLDVGNEGLRKFLYHDTIVNYFILLGLDMSKYQGVFDKVWGYFDNNGELRAAMLKRKTGNVQFYGDGCIDVKRVAELLEQNGFLRLIGEQKQIRGFKNYIKFSKCEEGAFISRLKGEMNVEEFNGRLKFRRLTIDDIERVVVLFKKSFKSFAPEKIMREKLLMDKGRGYYLEEKGQIVSIAQSAYECSGSAVIVGVATDPEHRNKGLASQCLIKLCSELVAEGKDLALQYDNQEAGRIYKRLGFVDTGRMVSLYPE